MNPLSGPVLQWIREGYPDGVPDDETAALLAVLQERIGGDRALDVLRRLHRDGLITDTAATALLPDDAQMRRHGASSINPEGLSCRSQWPEMQGWTRRVFASTT